MMWNDIVKANCARASTTASQPSNIGTTRRHSVRCDRFRKSASVFEKSRPNHALLYHARCGLYRRRTRNRRAALARTRSVQPQSPGDLGLHGAGLLLADQYRAANLSSRVEADRDRIMGTPPAAAFGVDIGDIVTADGDGFDRPLQRQPLDAE